MCHSSGYSTYLVIPLALLSRKHHFLVSYKSPSLNVNRSIPKDRPRGPCILVSSTSLMSSMDHLKGVLSSFRVHCVTCAWIQLHHLTIEIHTRYWFLHYLVKDPSCHLTLAHWWVYYGTHTISCPLWFSSYIGDSVRKPLIVMLPCIIVLYVAYCTTKILFWHSIVICTYIHNSPLILF